MACVEKCVRDIDEIACVAFHFALDIKQSYVLKCDMVMCPRVFLFAQCNGYFSHVNIKVLSELAAILNNTRFPFEIRTCSEFERSSK